ncbi:MAG: PKD domain-containing protein [Magnetococcales bacterium]|nr:PKD domain-containing protein [Magnetococcales bacterium]MBF0149203.1 PKD domain-containing protein [Magnetococcales bacterium]
MMKYNSIVKKSIITVLGIAAIMALPACGSGGGGGGGGGDTSSTTTSSSTTELTFTVASGAMVADTSLTCRNLFDRVEITEADLQSGKFILDQGFESLQAFDTYDIICRSSFIYNNVKQVYHAIISSADVLRNRNININPVTSLLAEVRAGAQSSTANDLFNSGRRTTTDTALNAQINTALNQVIEPMRSNGRTANFETASWSDPNNRWQDDFLERVDISLSSGGSVTMKDKKGNTLASATTSDFKKGQIPTEGRINATAAQQAIDARGSLPAAIPSVTAIKDSSGRITCDKRSGTPPLTVTCQLGFDENLKDIMWYTRKQSESGDFFTGGDAQETIIGGQGFSANYTFSDTGTYYIYVKVKNALYGNNTIISVSSCTAGAVESRSCTIANATAVEKRFCAPDRQWTAWGSGGTGQSAACSVQSCNQGFTQSGNQCVEGASTGGPTASFTIYPTSGDTSTIFTFDPSGSKMGTGTATGTLQTQWDLDGNGTWDTDPSLTSQDPLFYRFEQPGTYNVKLQAMDSSGLTSVVTQTITISTPTNFDPGLSPLPGDSTPQKGGTSGAKFKSMTWRIKDSCDDGLNVDYRFFDANGQLIYPDPNQKLVSTGYGKVSKSLVLCLPGETVCFGGNASGTSTYWGVGLDGRQSTSTSGNHCKACDETTVDFTPGCASTSSPVTPKPPSTPISSGNDCNLVPWMTDRDSVSESLCTSGGLKSLGISGRMQCPGFYSDLILCSGKRSSARLWSDGQVRVTFPGNGFSGATDGSFACQSSLQAAKTAFEQTIQAHVAKETYSMFKGCSFTWYK